jgi:DNA-binding transcriptional ArsR family regulator
MTSKKTASSSQISSPNQLPQIDRYIGQFLDAACDSHRRLILELLIPPNGQDAPGSYELRSGEIADRLGLAPSTTSEHLHKLLKLRLVSTRKEGTAVYYRLHNDHLVRAFHELLQALETHYSVPSSRMEA